MCHETCLAMALQGRFHKLLHRVTLVQAQKLLSHLYVVYPNKPLEETQGRTTAMFRLCSTYFELTIRKFSILLL